MGFFRKPVLSEKRRNALDEFRGDAIQALEELADSAPDVSTKHLYNKMIESVKRTPIYLYPRKVLRGKTVKVGRMVISSVTHGENVNHITLIQKGNMRFIIRSNYINMPAGHLFEGDRLTVGGIFTLAHEYAHFPKAAVRHFAAKNKMHPGQAEELLADVLSAKLAVKLGYPKGRVLHHFRGRALVYGRVPFRHFILKAIGA